MTPEAFRGAMQFTVTKYFKRLGKKDPIIQELTKARDYLDRWIEYEVDQAESKLSLSELAASIIVED
jgi:hypothetical protein